MNLTKRIIIFALFCFMPIAVNAQETPKNNISDYTLENGLRLIVIPDRRAPVVTHNIWYKVGGADDPVGKSGLAHFLEHLLFKGTKKYPAGEFSKKVAEIGGRENAFTTPDYTGYYQKVSPQALQMVMTYEADRMTNLILSEDEVLPERDVILEERRQRIDSNPAAILGETARATLFQHHPYGTPIIGWEHEIKSLSREDALGFYKKYYTPQNAIVVVAGDVDPETVLSLAKSTYGAIKSDQVVPNTQRLIEPEPTSARRVSYKDPRVTVPGWRRTYLVPSYFSAKGKEAEALDVLANVLGGTTTSRLHKALVLDKQLATGVGAYYNGGAKGLSSFTISLSPRGSTSLSVLETEVDAIVQELLETGITNGELKKGKNNLVKSTIFDRDSQTTMTRIYGATLAMGGEIEDIQNWTSEIEAVTTDDVLLVAKKYLKQSRSVTSTLLPQETN